MTHYVAEYFVVSMGIETELYRTLLHKCPEISGIVVDIRDGLRPPPSGQRGGKWPDQHVIDRIEALAGFEPAVEACTTVLRNHGIVIPACSGGNHRAPTVSARVGARSPNAYTVHCTINRMTFDQVMLIIRSCLRTKVPLATYSKNPPIARFTISTVSGMALGRIQRRTGGTDSRRHSIR